MGCTVVLLGLDTTSSSDSAEQSARLCIGIIKILASG